MLLILECKGSSALLLMMKMAMVMIMVVVMVLVVVMMLVVMVMMATMRKVTIKIIDVALPECNSSIHPQLVLSTTADKLFSSFRQNFRYLEMIMSIRLCRLNQTIMAI